MWNQKDIDNILQVHTFRKKQALSYESSSAIHVTSTQWNNP
jgi:hypothetical protein